MKHSWDIPLHHVKLNRSSTCKFCGCKRYKKSPDGSPIVRPGNFPVLEYHWPDGTVTSTAGECGNSIRGKS